MLFQLKMILSHGVTRDEVWIGNWIYWTLTLVTTNNYDSLTELHTPQITVTTAHIVFSVFTSRCLVAASNGGRFPSSGSPELFPTSATSYQLPASHFSQLQKQKLTAGNKPARSHLASGPAGTHDHIFVQC
jgi:hypothetical protein